MDGPSRLRPARKRVYWSAVMSELSQPAPLSIRTVEATCAPEQAIVIFANQPGCLMLESVCDTNGYGRYTIAAIHPVAQWSDRRALSGLIVPTGAVRPRSGVSPPTGVPAAPGWFGFIPYETGAALHGVTRDGVPARVGLRLYDTIALLDHQSGKWCIVAADLSASRRSVADRLDAVEQLLDEAAGVRVNDPASRLDTPPAVLVSRGMTREQYVRRVRRAKAYIAAGDIYQVNLTQRFTLACEASPVAIYQRLRGTNPASFAAYISDGSRTVISSSPELFLRLEGDRVVTRPIKGTAARSGDPRDDDAIAARLLSSEKDRAELNMIIDLMRNDLGRVCRPGTVRVACAAEVETHPTVLHLVSTIAGRLRTGVSAVDLLGATFPGGSITGCPKISALRIIGELEPTPRDVYCGSIGYIDLFGRMQMNIAIRTMLHEEGCVHVYGGGAITADSDADSEYAECLAKTAGMFRALQADVQGGDPQLATIQETAA